MKKLFTWWNNHKIFTWYNNQNKNVRVIIGSLSMMLFGYLMVNLVDLIFFGGANWQMADFWIIEYTKRLHEEGESNTYETHPQHVAVDVDSVVTIDKTKSKSNHTFIVDTGWAYYGRILKKVTEDDVMAEMEKLPPAR